MPGTLWPNLTETAKIKSFYFLFICVRPLFSRANYCPATLKKHTGGKMKPILRGINLSPKF